MAQPKELVLAFEGTGDGWYGLNDAGGDTRSFMGQVVKSKSAATAKYFAGPDKSGSRVMEIMLNAIKFFKENNPGVQLDFWPDMQRVLKGGLPSGRFNAEIQDRPKIYVFGYSRGGYIALCFCDYLSEIGLKVDFLGLFDAVDRDGSMNRQYDVQGLSSNVSVCYHAIRGKKTGSRLLFGNVGPLTESTNVHVKEFECLHATLGGFTLDSPEIDPAGNRLTSNLVIVDPILEIAAANNIATFMNGGTKAAMGVEPFKAETPRRELHDQAAANLAASKPKYGESTVLTEGHALSTPAFLRPQQSLRAPRSFMPGH